MMRVELVWCQEEPYAFETRLDLAERPVSYREFDRPPVVEARGVVMHRGGQKYAIKGSVTAVVTAVCVRCLEDVKSQIDRTFDLTFVPSAVATKQSRGHGETTFDDAYDGTYDGVAIELDPVIEEQFHLAIPIRFLCSEDCLGLCARCGARRKEGSCGCRDTDTPGQFEALRSLLH